jgi:hypothetical protein
LLTDFVVNGSVTEATCGAFFNCATSAATWALCSGAEIFPPAGARTTTRALAPSALASGNFSSRRSKAFCDSVPGMEKVSAGGVGAEEAATPAPQRITTHSSAIGHRRRKAKRPSV